MRLLVLPLVLAFTVARPATAAEQVVRLTGYVVPHQFTYPAKDTRTLIAESQTFTLTCDTPALVDLISAQAETSEVELARLRERLNAEPDKLISIHDPVYRFMRRIGGNSSPRDVSYAVAANRLKTIYAYNAFRKELRAQLVYVDGKEMSTYLPHILIYTLKSSDYPFFREIDLGGHCVAVQDIEAQTAMARD